MFDERLKCDVLSLAYDFVNRCGQVWLFEDQCCDMEGCVKLFTSIHPDVEVIQTYSGQSDPDTLYRNDDGKWTAQV